MWGRSKPTNIKIPSSVKTDIQGFAFFSELYKRTRTKGKYILDFSEVQWFEANLCAALLAIIQVNQEQGASFVIDKIYHPTIKATFRNNGMLRYLDAKAPTSSYRNSSVPLRVFNPQNEDEVEAFIFEYVLLDREVPEMSSAAKAEILRNIFELYQNAVMHSDSDKVYICGQFYVNKKRMALTMVDIGNTFRLNVRNSHESRKNYSGKESIEWAVIQGNSTKKEGVPGGLGLDVIREFLKLNQGKIQIHSSDGYWEERRGVTFAQDCDLHFSGSIVNMEFNLLDKNTYFTSAELSTAEIL